MDLLTDHHPDDPRHEMALTEAVLRAVANGTCRPAVRVYRPAPCLAFGRLDAVRPGFAPATDAARRHGFTPTVRLAGGHAVAYNRECVIVEVIRREAGVSLNLESRFQEVASLLSHAAALAGVDTEQGELEGEPCPGRFSLHLPAGPKVCGVAQRVIRGAALTTSVLVVRGGDQQRAVIAEIYEALKLPVCSRLAGAISDIHPGVTTDSIVRLVLRLAHERLQAEPTTVASTLHQAAAAEVARQSHLISRSRPRPRLR